VTARLLFVELLGGFGDLLLALPAVHALARTHAPAHVTVLTFPPGGELLAEDPWVQEVVEAAGDAREAVAAVLDRAAFDLVVSDTRHSGIPALLEACGADRVVADLWRGPPPDERIDLRFLRLLVEDGLVDPELGRLEPRVELTARERRDGRARLDGLSRRSMVLVPEVGMAIKRWPVDCWRGLAGASRDLLGASVAVVTGRDETLSAEVARGLGRLLPQMPLREVAAVLAAADVCVAPDTGLARLSAAVGTPTVCLFGPTVAGRFGLREGHANVSSPLPCDVRNPANMTEQSCWYSGICVYDNYASCMDDIPLQPVLAAVAGQVRDSTSCSAPRPSPRPLAR